MCSLFCSLFQTHSVLCYVVMRANTNMYTYACKRAQTHTHIHTHARLYTQVHAHTHTHKHTHTHTPTTTPTPSPTPTHTHREEYICYVQSTDSDHPRILLCKPQIVSLHSKYEDRISTQYTLNLQICLRNLQIDIGYSIWYELYVCIR